MSPAFPFTENPAQVVLALVPDTSAPRRARRALEQARIPEDLEHTAALLATELVANALRHARLAPEDRITFAATFVDDYLRVEVHDPGAGFDRERGMAGRGYGLRMVDKLASRWGVETDHGTRVWFEIDRRTRRFPRSR